MMSHFRNCRNQWSYKLLVSFVSYSFVAGLILPPVTLSAADPQKGILGLPMPGSMVMKSDVYTPACLKGIKIDPQNPLKFDFIIDSGKDELTGQALEEESNKLIKYFLATLTIPEEDLWVNLSPYESDRIIPEGFGLTEMGRDLLAQDYMLKQLVASLIYPEQDLGQEFWQRVYDRASKEYGTTNVPINTFNKVWIIPEDALVVEHNGSAFVVDSHLKVMLEEDYLALEQNLANQKLGTTKITEDYVKTLSKVSSDVVREILLPEIEKEVNEGKNFAKLRQIYNSMILATWYKQNLRATLLGQVYVNKGKIKGVDVDDREIKQKIYEQYLEAFRKGVYNYIREDYDMTSKQVIPRKYFSGGFDASAVSSAVRAVDLQDIPPSSPLRARVDQGLNISSPVVQVSAILAENPSETLAAKGVVTAEDITAPVVVASPVVVSPEILKLYQGDIEELQRAAFDYGDRSFIADENRAVAKSELARESKIMGVLLWASRNALPAEIAGKIGAQLTALVDVANEVVEEGYSIRLAEAITKAEDALLENLNEAELALLDQAALSSPIAAGTIRFQDLSPFGQQYAELRVRHYLGYVVGSQGRGGVTEAQAAAFLSRLNADISRMVQEGRTLKEIGEQYFPELSDETRAFVEHSRTQYELNRKSNARVMADVLIASLSAPETDRYDRATIKAEPITFPSRWPQLDVFNTLERIVRERGQVLVSPSSPVSQQFAQLSSDEVVGEIAYNFGQSYDTMMSLVPFLAETTGVSEERILQELNGDTYAVFADQLAQIAEMVKARDIFPEQVNVRVSMEEPEQAPIQLTGERTVPNVLFWAMKGDPWQSGHIWMILEAIIKNKIDKVVVMIDNSDPTRKPDLSSLSIREAFTWVIFEKYLKPFVQYTTLPKEMLDLFSADGETVIFYLAELNANQPMNLFYGAGSDHANLYELKKVAITQNDFMSTIAGIENAVERQRIQQMFADAGYINAEGQPVESAFQALVDRLKERGYLDAEKGKPVSGKFSAYLEEGKPEELLLSDLEGTGLETEDARRVVYQALFAPDVPRKLLNKMTSGEQGLRGFQARKDIQKMNIVFSQRRGKEVDETLLQAYETKLAAELNARGLPRLGLSTITQPMDTSSTDVRKRGQFWKVPWVSLQVANAFKMWGYEMDGESAQQELRAENLTQRVAQVLAGDLSEEARNEALERMDVYALNGLGLNAFDKYIMGEIIKVKAELKEKAGQPESVRLEIVDTWLKQVRELIFAQARTLAMAAIENPLPIRRQDQERMRDLLIGGRVVPPVVVKEYYETRSQRGLSLEPEEVAFELRVTAELIRATMSSPIKKILVVDDMEELRNLNRDIFSTIFSGAEVITAVNGEEGLNMFRENPDIDLVVTDLEMPLMNGEEMARTIRSERDVPVVLMSGNYSEVQRLSEMDEASGLKSGIFTEVIQKPYQLKTVIDLKGRLATSSPINKILLVDDTEGLRSLLRAELGDIFTEAEIITAANGEEGLSLFRENPDIGLVLTDLQMPVMNGEEMARTIRSERDVPVVLMTGNSREMTRLSVVDETSGLKSGLFLEVVEKPFNFDTIAALKDQLSSSSPVLQSITLDAEDLDLIGDVLTVDREVYGLQDAWAYAAISVLLANQLKYPEAMPPLRPAARILGIKWQDGAYPVEDAMFRLLPASLAVGYGLLDAVAYRTLKEAIDLERAGQFEQAENKLTELEGIDKGKADQILKMAAAVFNNSVALSIDNDLDLQMTILGAGRGERMPFVDFVALSRTAPIQLTVENKERLNVLLTEAETVLQRVEIETVEDRVVLEQIRKDVTGILEEAGAIFSTFALEEELRKPAPAEEAVRLQQVITAMAEIETKLGPSPAADLASEEEVSSPVQVVEKTMNKFRLQNRATRELLDGFVNGSIERNTAGRELARLLRSERQARGVSSGGVLSFAQRLNGQLEAQSSPLGGINLNPALLNLQIKRDNNGVPLPLPQQPVGDMNIDGFLPVIINITPIPNLPMLLGRNLGDVPAQGVPAEEKEGRQQGPSQPSEKTGVQFFFDDKDQLSLLNYN
ncbi:MAG TPA: response regulator [Candidatus Omnitrophota bacterium]|nr:response regulator [Candidatus Omnitrophota bacterium]